MSKMSRKRTNEDRGKELKRMKLMSKVAEGKLPYLTPSDPNFNSLVTEKYFNFVHEPSTCIELSFHEELAWALSTLRRHGYFHRDWVKVKGQTVQTPVSRTLVGVPGTTYKYLGLRLFTIPWSFGERQPESEVEFACQSFEELNKHFKKVTRKMLLDKEKTMNISKLEAEYGLTGSATDESIDQPLGARLSPGPSINDGTDFNVALINYMDPNDLELRLKPEPYYGMGPLAISWHMDVNLIRGSTVAVYSHTNADDEAKPTEDSSDWRVGLKVSWDVETPGVAVPLRSGESYMMLGDLNDTHQHCVLAGSQPRYSTTHRVADSCEGTLDYIQQRCKETLSNLTTGERGKFHLKSLDASCIELTEATHNEVEFEWLRQFWMQGTRHASERHSWVPAMEDLEKDWYKMELMTKLAVDEAHRCNQEGSVFAEVLLPYLEDRQKMRKECLEKFSPSLLDAMHPDFVPIHRPEWEDGDPSRPLPFDLKCIIKDMTFQCRRNRKDNGNDSHSSSTSRDSDA